MKNDYKGQKKGIFYTKRNRRQLTVLVTSWKCRNCCLKHVSESTMEGRKRKQLLDELKENRGYFNLKREAFDCTLWRIHFGRGYGLVTRETT
jgi:hypothetical protein